MKVKAANGLARILKQEGIPWVSCYPTVPVRSLDAMFRLFSSQIDVRKAPNVRTYSIRPSGAFAGLVDDRRDLDRLGQQLLNQRALGLDAGGS